MFHMSPLMMNQKGWYCLMRKKHKFINDWIFLSRSCSVVVLFKPHDIFRRTLFYERVCIWIVHVKGLKCCETRLVFCLYRFLTSFSSCSHVTLEEQYRVMYLFQVTAIYLVKSTCVISTWTAETFSICYQNHLCKELNTEQKIMLCSQC